MCHCTPALRTPFCGKPGCVPPAQRAPSLLDALKALHEVCALALAGKRGLQYANFETRDGRFVAASAAMRQAEAAIAAADAGPDRALRRAAECALAAYQHRFESVAPPVGRFTGPIDEEMAALHAALGGSS